MKPDTTEVVDQGIFATRLLDAPRDLVFQVWSDPAHIAQWWGPIGFTTTTHLFEFRAGGTWRFTMHGPDRDYENLIAYDEVVPPERIVYRHGGSQDVEPVSFRVEVAFEEDGKKTLITMRMVFPSNKARDYIIETYGAFEGIMETMQRLTEYLASRPD